MGHFAEEAKSSPLYIDIAANGNGVEKAALTVESLRRLDGDEAHVIEIGPGGGSAVDALRERASELGGKCVTLSLVELGSITSLSLLEACERFEEGTGGTTNHVSGDARYLLRSGAFEPESADVVAGSAVLHEVYSYGSGYRGLREAMASITGVLKPGGYFAYRDVFSVDAPLLNERVIQSYGSEGWLRFVKLFMPHYLAGATHAYHRSEDEPSFRQDSHRVEVEDIDVRQDTVITAPVGLFRELQRHYITLRDHLWRSGALGFQPILDGPLASQWIDARNGHKMVSFSYSDTRGDVLTPSQKHLLTAMSDTKGDMLSIDGDSFDAITDTAINDFLRAAEEGDTERADILEEWLKREGSETYAYMTPGQLLGAMALTSIEASGGKYVMLPERFEDVIRAPRAYYNRLLGRTLPNPLYDGKQLILFRKTSLDDLPRLEAGLKVVAEHCTRATLATLYPAVNKKV